MMIGTGTPTGRTATAYASPTLNAPVEILDQPRLAGTTWTEVRTLPGGVGGWAKAGKPMVVRTSILIDITDADGEPETTDIPVYVKPEPITEPMTRQAYMDVLVARERAWAAAHPGMPPALYEWFILDGEENFVEHEPRAREVKSWGSAHPVQPAPIAVVATPMSETTAARMAETDTDAEATARAALDDCIKRIERHWNHGTTGGRGKKGLQAAAKFARVCAELKREHDRLVNELDRATIAAREQG